MAEVEEEGELPREGRYKWACVYDCGWSPVNRASNVVFPEPRDREVS